MPAPDDWLDRPIWVLDVGQRGFAPVTWRDDLGLAGLAFTDRTEAERHRERLAHAHATAAPRPRVRLLELAGDDARAREEWLQAVLNAGAARVGFDVDIEGSEPAAFELTGALLIEVLGHKQGLSCL